MPLGLISGYVGGWLDRVLVLIMDALFAFPYLLLAIVIAFLLSDKIGQGILTAAIAITVVYIPQYFRVVRNHVISVREEPYVEAARALGAPRRTIIGRYVFVNVIQNVPVIATLNAADAILTLAALGFLGFGIQPTAGRRVGLRPQARAIDDAGAGIWWTGLFPGLAIVLLVTGLTLVGEGLNDVLNPLIRKRRIRRPEIPRSGTPMAGRRPSRLTERRGHRSPASLILGRNLRVWYGTERGPGARGRRRLVRDPARRDARPGRRVRLRQVDPRPRRSSACCRRAPRSTARCASADATWRPAEAASCGRCAGPSSA